MSRPSVDDPGSDTESVLSSSQPPSTLAGAGAGPGSRSLAGGLYSSNASTLNLSVFAGGPTASHSHPSSSSPSSPAASAGLLGGFNALSTVLNSPHKRQHPIDPNSSRYPPLPTHKDAEIKRPKRESVKQYVDGVSEEWDKWTRSRRLGASGSAKTIREKQKQQRGEGDAAGEASTDAAIAKKGKLPPLSAVPQVFFEEDFNLGNPYTFDVVTERYGAVTAPSSSSAPPDPVDPATAASQGSQLSLDDKLSHYSDLVEQHLLSEISLRSSSFFSALSTLQDLSSASSSTLSVIATLRSDLISVREQHVKAGLQVVRKQDERRVLVRRMRGVERVKRWCEGKRMVELMVGQGEYEEGLMVIEGLREDLRPKRSGERKAALASLRDGASSPALNGDEEHDGLNGLTGAPADEDEDEEEEVDLSQIPAISALVPDLDELEGTISGQLEAELVGVLQHGLEQQQDAPSSELSWPLHDRVRPLIHGLVRTSGLEQAMTSSYRPLALISIRHALRKSLQPSAATLTADGQGGADAEPMLAALFDLLDDDVAASGKGESRSGEAGARAAQRLREMTTDEFAPLLQRVCGGLEAQVARIEVQERGVLSILDELARHEKACDAVGTTDSSHDTGTASHHQYQMPTQISYGLPNTLASQLHASIEAAHILVARLISLRATAHAQLSMRDFLGLYDPLMAFVERTERIEIRPRAAAAAAATAATAATTSSSNSVGMRRLIPLRSTLLNQSKDWLRHFHRVRLEKAARWVEEETWSQAEVPATSVELVRKLVQCASEDAEGWGPTDQQDEEKQEDAQGETSPTLVIPSEAPSSDGGTAVDAGDRKSFYVVPATLRVLDLTREYTQAVIGMSRVTGTMEIMSREVEFLKQFNSRTCQVVLGAGAMRSAGLKNITAKHLALASQSLSLFIHLIPYLRECVRRHLPDERQAVMLVEFDKLRRDFQEHMFEIHAKLVAIMGDRLGVHCRTLQGTQWNAPLPSSGEKEGEQPQPLQPNKAIQDLVKETSTLHKVLSKYLHSNVVESITSQVLSAITQRIGTEFARVEVTREGGENAMKRMEADVDYLDVKLGSLKGVQKGEGEGGWDVRGLRAVVSSKTPPPPPAQAAAATANNISSKGAPPAAAAPANAGGQGSAPSSPVPGASSSPRTGPAAYRSKMFPFGRRAAANQQQQGTPPRAGSPAATNAGSPTLARTASTGAQGRTSHDTPPSLARTASALGGAAGGRGSVDELFAPSQQQQQQGSAESSNRPSMDVVSLPPSVVAAVPPEEAVVVEEKAEVEGPGPSTEPQEAAEQTTTVATVNEDEGPAIVAGDGDAAGAEAKVEAKDQPASAPEAQPASGEASAEARKEEAQPAAAVVDEATAEPSSSTDSPPPPSPPSHDQPAAAPASSSTDGALSPSTPTAPQQAQEVPISPAPTPTTNASGSATPTRPARQTLQQRLAEAARKRSAAAAAASAAGIGIRPSTPPSKGEEKEMEKEVPPPPTPEKDRSRSREPVGRGSVEERADVKADAEKQSVEMLSEQQQPEEEKVPAAEEKEVVPETDAPAPAPVAVLVEAKDDAAAADATAQVSGQEQPKEEAQAAQESPEEPPSGPSVEKKEAAPSAAVDEPLSTPSQSPVAKEEAATPSASEPPASVAAAKDGGASGQAEAVAVEAKPVEEQQKSVEEAATADPVSTDGAPTTTTTTTTSSGAATPKSTADGSDNEAEAEGEGDGGEDEEAEKSAAATAAAEAGSGAAGGGGGGGNGKKSGGGNKKKNKKKKGKK